MSNHLGDTNKRVSETPISDSTPHNVADLGMLCRRLERELNAANDRIKRLEEFVDQLTNPKFTRDDLPKEALLQRIKRLETLGHELRECANLIGNYKSNEMETIEQAEAAVEAWDKEVKP